jgi:hypothetical protein
MVSGQILRAWPAQAQRRQLQVAGFNVDLVMFPVILRR